MQQELKNKFLPTMKEDIASLTILCGLRRTQLRIESITAANKKINANPARAGLHLSLMR